VPLEPTQLRAHTGSTWFDSCIQTLEITAPNNAIITPTDVSPVTEAGISPLRYSTSQINKRWMPSQEITLKRSCLPTNCLRNAEGKRSTDNLTAVPLKKYDVIKKDLKVSDIQGLKGCQEPITRAATDERLQSPRMR